jgi:hypothetical protein
MHHCETVGDSYNKFMHLSRPVAIKEDWLDTDAIYVVVILSKLFIKLINIFDLNDAAKTG